MKITLILILLCSSPIMVSSSSVNSGISEDRERLKMQSETTKEVSAVPKIAYFFSRSGILNCFENATHWAEKEETTFKLAKLRHPKLKEEALALAAYIKDYESTTEISLQRTKRRLKISKIPADVLASSGIASYTLIYRYVQMLQRLKEVMAVNFLDKVLHDNLWAHELHNLAEGYVSYFIRNDGELLTDWPNVVDLALAMHSLVHIQEVYNYNYKLLPSILSPETKKPPQLNAFHSAQIGLHAMRKKHFAVAIAWMEYSIEKVNSEGDSSISLPLLETYLELAVKMHNLEHVPRTSRSKYFDHLFTNVVKAFQPSSRNKERVSNRLLKLHKGMKYPGYENVYFKSICAGKDYRTQEQLSKLYCWYDMTSSPARAIQPFKKELLSSDPEIIQVYDFIGEKLISRIVNDKTKCSGVSDDFDLSTVSQIMRIRTPTTCWPVQSRLEELWHKVSSLTSTDLRTEEMSHHIGSVHYLPGRFYAAHRDALQLVRNREVGTERNLAENGDRLFSLVVYLNDVPAGGWTSFSGAGTAAPPVKGSVVVWSNLYKNGSAREDSWHGACPVIYGHKQAAVVLLRSHSQFRTHLCTLNQHE